MALYINYVELDDIKRYLRIPGNYEGTINTEEDSIDDINLNLAIAAASRAIDAATNRQFGLSSTAVANIYTPYYDAVTYTYRCNIDDLMTTSGLVIESDNGAFEGVYDETITDDEYYLAPFNSPQRSRPWTEIVFRSGANVWASRRYPVEGTLQVTAKWGWTNIPDTIKEATLLQAARFFKRKDAPFGVAGSVELGSEMRLLAKVDPDVKLMVDAYKRWRV